MDYQKTGQVISTRRQELALTQKQLAEKLNISDRTVSRWERGVGFPDMSLLEPLADALGLSLGELIRGERLPPARQPSPEEEQEVRATAIGLGGHLRQALRRTRRLLIALAVLLACVSAAFLALWFNPFQVYPLDSQPVSAARAAKVCPFSLITRQEFELAARLLADEKVTALFSPSDAANPPLHSLDTDLIPSELLEIDGQAACVTDFSVCGWIIYVDYCTQPETPYHPRCILAVCKDGTISKTSCRYRDGTTACIVKNTDNTAFTLSRQYRDLFYFLHE